MLIRLSDMGYFLRKESLAVTARTDGPKYDGTDRQLLKVNEADCRKRCLEHCSSRVQIPMKRNYHIVCPLYCARANGPSEPR